MTRRRTVVIRISVVMCSLVLASGFITWRMGGCAAKNAPASTSPSDQSGSVMPGSKSIIITDPPDSLRRDDPVPIDDFELFSGSKSGVIVRPKDVDQSSTKGDPDAPSKKPKRRNDDKP